MTRLAIVSLLVLLLGTACQTGRSNSQALPSEARLASEMGVVLPEGEAARMLGLPSFIAERDWGAIAVWNPPTGVIAELERRLPREFSETLARAVLDDPRPQFAAADYYRQYAGFIRRDSTRGVLVHGMYRPVIDYIDSTTRARQDQGHRAYFPDWRTTYVGGADGGVQIFHAVYSVERQYFDSLRFNPIIGERIPIRPRR